MILVSPWNYRVKMEYGQFSEFNLTLFPATTCNTSNCQAYERTLASVSMNLKNTNKVGNGFASNVIEIQLRHGLKTFVKT